MGHKVELPINDGPRTLAAPVDPNRDHVLGPADAPVTLVEYGDYECPDCGRAYPLLHRLKERFPNQLRFVFRHFPIYTIHQHASQAAQAAEAAGAQGKFWPMHDLLYQNQDRLEVPDFTHYALRAGLEIYKFEAMFGSAAFARRIEADYASGLASGVSGTPALFFNGVRYSGAIDLETLAAAIVAASAAVPLR